MCPLWVHGSIIQCILHSSFSHNWYVISCYCILCYKDGPLCTWYYCALFCCGCMNCYPADLIDTEKLIWDVTVIFLNENVINFLFKEVAHYSATTSHWLITWRCYSLQTSQVRWRVLTGFECWACCGSCWVIHNLACSLLHFWVSLTQWPLGDL